jgi:heme exporter protein A
LTQPVRALEVENIARRFGRRWVLRGVTLELRAGEAVALMGRNGSGKTTLLRIICTTIRPTRGRGSVFGHELVKEADEVREQVGILGHHAGLYDDLTASENLRFAMQMYGLSIHRSEIERALDEVGLGAEVKERVRGFSAGMRRRLALARLVLRPPRLLLLDEPYAAFDQPGIDQVNAYVRRIVDGGGAALIATHDLARAKGVAERVVRIEEGRIALDTATDELLREEQDSAV